MKGPYISLVIALVFTGCSTMRPPMDWNTGAKTTQLDENKINKKPEIQKKTGNLISKFNFKTQTKKMDSKKQIPEQKGKDPVMEKETEPSINSKMDIEIKGGDHNYTIPEWVLNGRKLDPNENKFYLYAVGMANKSHSDLVLRARSKDKAREQMIVKISEFKSIMDQTLESNLLELDGLTEKDKRKLKSKIVNITSTILAGIELSKAWKHPTQTAQFTLARLNLSPFQSYHQDSSGLDEFPRTYLKIIFDKSWEKYNQKERTDYIFFQKGNQYVLKNGHYYFY